MLSAVPVNVPTPDASTLSVWFELPYLLVTAAARIATSSALTELPLTVKVG